MARDTPALAFWRLLKTGVDLPHGIGPGYCHCGCGQKTKIAEVNRPNRGWVKGQPKRFVAHHKIGKRPVSLVDYVEEDRDYKTSCWIWQRKIQRNGYPATSVKNRDVLAHRHYYEQRYGSIPPGLQVDHLCNVKACVNPDHLEAVTGQENTHRSSATRLTASDVEAIRHAYQKGLATQHTLAARYDVSQGHISEVLTGVTWGSGARHTPERRGRGVRPPNTKLSDEEVRQIRSTYAGGKASMRKLGELYGVSTSTIELVINRKRHASVDE